MLKPPDPGGSSASPEEGRDLCFCFLICGHASPDILSRVIGLFAQQALVPEVVWMRRIDEMALVRVEQDRIDGARALILAEKMRSIVTVRSVQMKPSMHGPAST